VLFLVFLPYFGKLINIGLRKLERHLFQGGVDFRALLHLLYPAAIGMTNELVFGSIEELNNNLQF